MCSLITMGYSFPFRLKWAVLAASTYATTVVYGLAFSFGSIITDMLDKFQEPRSKTATVQATLVGVTLSTGVISGILVKKQGLFRTTLVGAIMAPVGLISAFFSTRIEHLYVCIGVITGFGTSLLYVSSSVAIGMAFIGPQKLLALAIQNAGINVAGIVLPYLLKFLVSMYGLNGTFFIYGGIQLNCLIVASIFRILEKRHYKLLVKASGIETSDNIAAITKDELARTNKEMSNNKKTHYWSFYMLLSSCKENITFLSLPYYLNLLALTLVMSSLNGYNSLLLDILQWKSMTPSYALLAFPVAHGTGLLARLLSGVLKQCKGVNSLILPTLFSLCGFCGLILIHSSSQVFVILTGCGLAGVAVSGVITAGMIVVVQLVDPEHLALGFGLINTATGLFSAALGPIYGSIRDTSSSYSTVIQLTAAMQFLGACSFIATFAARKITKTK